MICRTLVLMVASFLLGVMGSSGHDNFCRDLVDYGPLNQINEKVEVCTSTLEKTCVDETVSRCLEVTELECTVELFTDCSMTMGPLEIEESKPATLTKILPTCTKKFRKEKHEKIHYECQEVTKKHCTTLWKIVAGEKVWAGNDDDCKDVTWEECNPVPVEVEWDVPYMDCTDTSYDYLSYETTTTEVMANTMDCEVKERVVCEPTTSDKCAQISYTTCSEEPVEECHEVDVPCPNKEIIHRQWCLFGQGEQPGEQPSTGGKAEDSDLFDLRDTEEEGSGAVKKD